MAAGPLPTLNWTTLPPKEHIVQFYDKEVTLIQSLADYLAAGFAAGERGLVIATQSHLLALDDAMRARGVNLTALRLRGEYLPYNAAEMLSRFMHQGMPDPARFDEVMGKTVRAVGVSGRPLRAFGEMVAILWAEGNAAGAIELEALWNELIAEHSFRLMCAYPMARFRRGSSREAYDHICAHHTRLIPALA